MKIALVLIDVQKGFNSPYWGPRNNPHAEENMEKILKSFREKKLTVIHVQHMSTEPQSPLRLHQEGNDFKPQVQPLADELVIQKQVNSSFIGTTLEEELKKRGITRLVLVGISTNHCVSTTARMAGNMGYETYVAYDGTHTFDFKGLDGKTIPAQVMHDVGLAEIHKEFATVLWTEEILEMIKEPVS